MKMENVTGMPNLFQTEWIEPTVDIYERDV